MAALVDMRSFESAQEATGNFGRYQLRVFLATQLSYIAVTGSMLCTMYDTLLPPAHMYNCSENYQLVNESSRAYLWDFVDFRSLLLELDLLCAHKYVPTFFQTSVMIGGVVGAIVSGFLADRHGRRPVAIGTLSGVMLMNLVLSAIGGINWSLTALFLFMLGFSGGGFMVVNLVLILEVVGTQYWRLGVTAFNGWPMGLMCMSLMGYLTGHWRWYHLCLSGVAAVCLIPLTFGVFESARWLVQHDRNKEATQIMLQIAAINGKTLSEHNLELADKRNLVQGGGTGEADRKYTYVDLVRYRQVMVHLGALFYSWLASSIISFGIYFNISSLEGDRYLKTFLLGCFKGLTGLIPFVLANCVGRKPVLLTSVVVACSACWAAVGVFVFSMPHAQTALVVFSLLGASAIDPIWKVNHLYSTELFPTVVRNMARAVCNTGSRLGSVIAPQVAYLSTYDPSLSYVIFGCLALVQLLISCIFLPETKDRPLPDRLENSDQERAAPVALSTLENAQNISPTLC